MPATPTISIVVPSWRQGRFLRQCLLSLVHQTHESVEIIVCDNESDDETAAIIETFRPRLSRVICRKDEGQSDALRRGFAEARGEVLGWLNADDMLMPAALEIVMTAFATNRKVDVLYGHCALLDEAGQFMRYFDDISPFSLHQLCNYSDFIAQPSTFFRREAYEAVGGIDASLTYAMDWDLWCRMGLAGSRFHFIDEVLAGARVHDNSKTATGGWRRLIELARINKRHGTTFLPMVPTLYLAHLFSKHLKPYLGPIHQPLRSLVRALVRWPELHKSVVNGLQAPAQVVEPSFRICMPVFDRLRRADLDVEGGEGSLRALLDGETLAADLKNGRRAGHLGWTLPNNGMIQAFELEGSFEGAAAPRPALRLELEKSSEERCRVGERGSS